MDCEYFSYEFELVLKFGVQLRAGRNSK